MTINPEALADADSHAGRQRLVDQIQPGELFDLGYSDDLHEWVSLDYPGVDVSVRQYSAEEINRSPVGRTTILPAFFRWLRENQRGPWAPNHHDTVTPVAGGFHVGDTAAYRGFDGSTRHVRIENGPVVGNRSVIWFDSTHGVRVWAEPDRFTLVACPHEDVPGNLVTDEQQLDPDPAGLPDGSPIPNLPGYIPWGPGHPDWDPFWDRAELEAGRRNYCNEFDAVVEAVGGRRRRPRRERVTYQVTAEIVVEATTGLTLTPDQMLALVRGGQRFPEGISSVGSPTRVTVAALTRTPVEG